MIKVENFLKIRKAKGLRQKDVANVLGITRNAYGKKETKVNAFTTEEIYKLAKFYEISMEELAFEEM